MSYDLGIIGAGPAGYEAGIHAAQEGLKTVLFDKEYIGGVCLNDGCIPTKTLLHSAKLYTTTRDAQKYGLKISEVTYDLDLLMKRKQKVVKKLVGGVKSQLKSSGVEIVMEEASVRENRAGSVGIEAGGKIYQCRNLLIATGSRPIFPPVPGLKPDNVYTSRQILKINNIPESLTIIGGGVIGVEFADFFASMGTQVTIVEMLEGIISGMDREVASILQKELTRKGVQFLLSAKVTAMNGREIIYTADDSRHSLKSEAVLLSVGRKPAVNLPGIENLGIVYSEKGICTDSHCRTNIPNVYAAGDVNGYSLYAHTASREGHVAVNHILGKTDPMRYEAVPGVVYTNPETAGAGLTEEEAQKQGISYAVRKLPMGYAGRYIVENEGMNGLCKIIYGKQHQNILGVHLIGNSSSEIIASAVMAIEEQLTIREFQEMIFPHPTVSEIFKETSLKG